MLVTKLETKIVTEKEWERLISSNPRYEHVTDENMGFADPERGKAFVRQTYWPELNKYLLRHEFEHLLEDAGTDEDEHGVRHKKFFKQILAPVGLPILGALLGPAVGGLLAAGGGGLSGFGSALASGVGGSLGGAAGQGISGGNIGKGALLGGVGGVGANIANQGLGNFLGGFSSQGQTPSQSMAQTQTPTQSIAPVKPSPLASIRPSTSSFGPLIGSQLTGLGNQLTRPSGGSSFNNFAPGTSLLGQGIGGGLQGVGLFGPSFPNSLIGTAGQQAGGGVQGGGGGGGGGGTPPSGGGNFLSSLGSGLINTVFPNSTGQGNPGQGVGSQLGQGLGQFLGKNVGNIGQLIASAGALGIGQNAKAAQIPPVPDLTQLPSIQNIAQTAGKGLPVSPLGQFGQQDLTSRLTTPFQGVNPLVLQSIRDSFDRQRRDFASQFKTIRPNADIASDYDYARNLALLDRQEAQAIGDVQQQEFTRFQAERTGDIASALGIDHNTLGTLMDIAQLDVDRIQTQFGINAQQAQQFKNTFGQISAMFAARPLGLTSFKP